MIENYLKVSLRRLGRHKYYTLSNIVGLAVGMACCILIMLWVKDEVTFDTFHQHADRIYRVVQDINFSDHSTRWAITQGPLGAGLQADFTEIENTTRTWRSGQQLRYGEVVFRERGMYVDSTFFQLFTFPLTLGDPATALRDPHTILLSERLAAKLFGADNPQGRVLNVGDEYDCTVTGVFENPPGNSQMTFDYLFPMALAGERGASIDQWGNSTFTTYVMLRPGADAAAVVGKISGYLYDKPTLEEDARLNLQPLLDVHLHSNFEFENMNTSDARYVYIFSMIALGVLLIACINYTNLATARSAGRSREVGLRKVVGARKSDLIRQFFGESVILTALALCLALILVELSLPLFNVLANKQLSLSVLGNAEELLGIVALGLLTALVSGSYPALYIAAFQPSQILKHSSSTNLKSVAFRKVLVMTQFVISIALISSALIIHQQLQYLRNRHLGYDKDNVIYFYRSGLDQQFDAFKEILLGHPDVLNVTATTDLLTRGKQFTNSLWRWEGKNPDEELLLAAVGVDYDFFDTFRMEILAGRAFSREFGSDSAAVMVNQTAAALMGFDDPLGKSVSIGDFSARIIGVVQDYNLASLHKKIEPLIIYYQPESSVICARIHSENVPQTIGFIQEQWELFNPGKVFQCNFLDQALNDLYYAEANIGRLVTDFTFIAILISCLGLFGLAAFNAEQRTKEIGIRKVLGASSTNIIKLMSKQLVGLVIAANLVAWPVAWFTMQRWLQNFAYRIELSLGIFLIAGGLALAIALLTVSIQTLRAATADPIKSLRYE